MAPTGQMRRTGVVHLGIPLQAGGHRALFLSGVPRVALRLRISADVSVQQMHLRDRRFCVLDAP